MKKEELLKTLAELTGIPLAWRREDQSWSYASADGYYQIIAASFLAKEMPGTAFCEELTEGIFYGGLTRQEERERILFGPVSGSRCGVIQARAVLRFMERPAAELSKALRYFENIQTCSIHKLAQLIRAVAFLIWQEEYPLAKLMPFAPLPAVSEDLQPWAERPSAYIHDTAEYERALYSYIHAGNVFALKNFLQDSAYLGNEGRLGETAERHRKNAVISSIAIAAHSANEGGAPYETAMNQADEFIRQTEAAKTVSDLYRVHRSMLLTFANMVERHKLNRSDTALSTKVKRYVQRHLYEAVTVRDIADALGVNQNYLSHHFSVETGMTISKYTARLKIDEARRLLKVTEWPVIQISNLLAFSSQSYFCDVFRKETGISPTRYRKEWLDRM